MTVNVETMSLVYIKGSSHICVTIWHELPLHRKTTNMVTVHVFCLDFIQTAIKKSRKKTLAFGIICKNNGLMEGRQMLLIVSRTCAKKSDHCTI